MDTRGKGMREPVLMGPLDRQPDDAGLLVVGYRGTLRAASTTGMATPRSPNEDEYLPPIMERTLEPWLATALVQLTQRAAHDLLVFQGGTVPLTSLLLLLKERLIGILTRAVGDCCIEPEEQLAPSSASDILRKFPLLTPLIRSVVAEWVTATATFLQRLHRDKQWIAGELRLSALPPIEAISGTTSDVHAGGHSVLRVRFLGGGCLYYKPRAVTGEWLWHELLEAIARLDPELRLPAARVLTNAGRFHYGWAESVNPEESLRPENFDEGSKGNPAATLDYWHAAGAMLCLAQHARLTDLHLGNIVATPGGPAVTDAECLATPDLYVCPDVEISPENTAISDAVESIVSTGLLPSRSVRDWPDVSGFFGHAAPVSGVKLPKWTISSDGRYRLTAMDAELVGHRNALVQTTAVAVLPQILSGYRHAAELLLRVRETLIGPGTRWRGVLETVHAPRMVVRDTLTYGLLLSRSLEPRYLRSWHRRRRAILSGLAAASVGRSPGSLLRMEARALLEMHVPRLVVLPGTRTMAAGSGRAVARGFAACTPAQSLLGQIEGLSTESIENIQVPALLASIL
ncbi:MAG: DUF4135 domain-containing protein [Acidobacteriaceae bacterium]